MQWLINIISELFTNRHRYFDRGDPAVADFVIGDLILDNTWRDLDLSAIVPSGAVAVNIKLNIRANRINRFFGVRPNGNVNVWNTVALWTQVADQQLGGVYVLGVNSDRKIEYRAPAAFFDLINILICGWWLE